MLRCHREVSPNRFLCVLNDTERNRNGGHVKPPLQHDYARLKKKLGAEQAAKVIRFRLKHIQEMLNVAKEDGITEECDIREVDSLDVYFATEMFEAAKRDLETWKTDMPEESKDYEWVQGRDAAKVSIVSHEKWTRYTKTDVKRFHLSDHIAGAVHNSAGAVHPYRFVTGILSLLLRNYPGNFYLSTNTPCTAVYASSHGPMYTVETPHGTVITKHVIHATNAWVSHLLPKLRSKVFTVRGNMTAQRPGTDLPPSTLDGGRSWVFYDGHIGYDYLTQLPNGERELIFGGGFVQAGEDGLGEIGITDDSVANSGVVAHLSGALPFLFGERNWGSEVKPDEDEVEDGKWLDGRTKAFWSGIIGISADSLPWVGRIPDRLTERPLPLMQTPILQQEDEKTDEKQKAKVKLTAPGEWVAAGYSGEGMAHAFLSGRAVALQVLDRPEEAAVWLPECLAVTETRWEKARADDLIEDIWG